MIYSDLPIYIYIYVRVVHHSDVTLHNRLPEARTKGYFLPVRWCCQSFAGVRCSSRWNAQGNMTQAWSRTELGSSWAHGSCFCFLNSVACSFQRFSESMAVPFGSTHFSTLDPKQQFFQGVDRCDRPTEWSLESAIAHSWWQENWVSEPIRII